MTAGIFKFASVVQMDLHGKMKEDICIRLCMYVLSSAFTYKLIHLSYAGCVFFPSS